MSCSPKHVTYQKERRITAPPRTPAPSSAPTPAKTPAVSR